ncbi:m-phase inducer phosphatase [Coemansia spiralis]|uniref:M-phase inducer phosphatase n=3 Tax=Coemansia TaxID=4863 RepID=A0A9W8GME6_9FUNG|nr:m-phase inducer phosphatase [Coemansia spiralis]
MNTVASDRRSSSSYMSGVSSPTPFSASPAPSTMRKHPSTAPAAPTSSLLHRSAGEAPPSFSSLSSGNSPMASLVKDLNSSLHLDTSGSSSLSLPRPEAPSTPVRGQGSEPFVCRSAASPFDAARGQTTPLLSRSRKRQMEEQGSPALAMHMNSPSAAFWARKQQPGRGARGSMLTFNSAGSPGLALFRRESLNTDDDSSFDDDGSLTSLPRMRGLAGRRQGEAAMDCTPSRPAGGIKRARQVTGIANGFQPILEEQDCETEQPAGQMPILGTPVRATPVRQLDVGCFSPFTRSQPEFHKLPCESAAIDSIMRVEAETVSELLTGGRFSDLYDEKIIVDCRFPYEYEGGHIAGAANAPTMEALERLLLDRPRTDKRVVVVLHCEYSLQRAPSMACHLRRRDREVNMHRYPYLHYPEIYVLKGGYRNFFSFHKTLCEPQSYVEMNDEAHMVDCRQRMLQFNRQFKRTKSMNDAALCRSVSVSGPAPSLLSRTVAGSSAAMFMANAQSPTNMVGRTAPPSYATTSLPARARRIGRTHSARPGINLVDFSQMK